MSYGDGPGFDSEELVKELLQKSGWGVKELRKASDGNRAPLLEMDTEGIRVPDFQAHHERHSPRYVEVKSFRDSVYYGVEDVDRHAYEERKHEDYREFQQMAEHPVYVFVHERKPGVILRQRIRHLSPDDWLRDDQDLRKHYGREHDMVFFNRDQFETVTTHLADLSAGYAQDGLIKESVDISPFGLSPASTGQATLTGGNF